MKKIQFQMLPEELWWGGTSSPANEQCYDNTTEAVFRVDRLGNQSAPFYLSSQGRYVWADSPPVISFQKGQVTVEGRNVELVAAGSTLRDAYLAAMKKHFPFEQKALPEKFFTTAQYNTWMEFPYHPTQEKVLQYARDILDHGYEPGILIIDEGWHSHYGTWEFDFGAFPDPKAMVEELHAMGFTVMLWVVPFVTLDGPEFLDHAMPWIAEWKGIPYEPRLVRQESGEVAVYRWWEGLSGVLDLTQENDRNYLDGRLRHLMEAYGVDGFKFDGGNLASLQEKSWLTPVPHLSMEALNKAWNDFGTRYTYHEYKDTYDRGGRATIQRIRDRYHTWDNDGIASLVPVALMQGLLGYPYLCPDMIGGGEWKFNLLPDFRCDEELFVRMAQCSALFPMMQFSWAPWRMLSERGQELCLAAAKLHAEFGPRICSLIRQTTETGEPVLRCLEYAYPHQGYERVWDQFLLGEDILVCPVLEPGVTERAVHLPEGQWKYCDGTLYQGGGTIRVAAPLERLPYFEKV